MALSVSTGSDSGQQSNPQSSVGSSGVPALAGNVQPGTPTNDLTSSNGVSLTQTPLTTVNIGSSTASTTAAPAGSAKHHVSPVLIVLVVLLFIVAGAIFAAVSQSGKKHNQY
jgi:cobalamin biosynthesis Mg chelatase CobN